MPITDGTTEGMVEDVIVLKYGEPDSLEVVKNNADRLAAVLVEPIQSRNPALQPEAFVKELRRITEENDIALIFDEMITGFRMAPGGMQEIWGVRADMTTYGKVLGGGMPIGCVAGKRRFLDAIDGGAWHYGDESLPGVHTAFVAGTFNQHALSMAAAEAVLDRIAEEGPGLARRLAAMTEDLCRRCDALFEKYGLRCAPRTTVRSSVLNSAKSRRFSTSICSATAFSSGKAETASFRPRTRKRTLTPSSPPWKRG